MSLEIAKILSVGRYISKDGVPTVAQLRGAIKADPDSKAEGPLNDLRQIVGGTNTDVTAYLQSLENGTEASIVTIREELRKNGKIPLLPPDADAAAEIERLLAADAEAKAKADADAAAAGNGSYLFNWLKDIPVVGIVIGAILALVGIYQANKHDNFFAGILAAIGGAAVAGFGAYKYYKAPAKVATDAEAAKAAAEKVPQGQAQTQPQ